MTIIVCCMDDTGLMMYMYMYVCECMHVSDDTDLIMYMVTYSLCVSTRVH